MRSKTKLVIIGGLGNASVACSTIEDCIDDGLDSEIVGFLNDSGDDELLGYPILGRVSGEEVERLKNSASVRFVYTLVSTKLGKSAKDLFDGLGVLDSLQTIVHPSAVVSRHADLGPGTIVHPLANLSPGVSTGYSVQIFAQAMLGHDSSLGDLAYVANNACTAGFVRVLEGAYLGVNSAVRERVSIGEWAVVGMGSTVTKDVESNATVIGNPAKEINLIKRHD